MTLESPYQSLGIVDQLIASDHTEFAYPERAQVLAVIGNGTSERNYVLQGSSETVRQAGRTWIAVPTADMHTIRGYATSKAGVTLTEEDGTDRTVIVMDFSTRQRFVGYWDVSVSLLETADPSTSGS